jgi:rhodanese-related sulfurtransferase
MNESISPADLHRLLESGAKVRVFDVRREKDRVDVDHPIPNAEWRDPEHVAEWGRDVDKVDQVIVYCVHGHQVSQSTRNTLRDMGIAARIVEGGIEAWCDYLRAQPQNPAM